jgi:hypothetical protein
MQKSLFKKQILSSGRKNGRQVELKLKNENSGR